MIDIWTGGDVMIDEIMFNVGREANEMGAINVMGLTTKKSVRLQGVS